MPRYWFPKGVIPAPKLFDKMNTFGPVRVQKSPPSSGVKPPGPTSGDSKLPFNTEGSAAKSVTGASAAKTLSNIPAANVWVFNGGRCSKIPNKLQAKSADQQLRSSLLPVG